MSLALARVVRIHGCVLLRSPPLDVTDIDLEAGNAELAQASAEARVAWALMMRGNVYRRPTAAAGAATA